MRANMRHMKGQLESESLARILAGLREEKGVGVA